MASSWKAYRLHMTRTRKHELHETRERIVGAACNRFRDGGFDNASIAEIMESAGMTHGAFYRYFSSKEDLIMASIEAEFSRYPAAIDAETVIRHCLGEIPNTSEQKGCPMVVLTADVGRCSSQVQDVFLAKIEGLFSSLAKSLDGAVVEPRSVALAIFSIIVGSVHLSRAVGNSALSAEILKAGAVAARSLVTRQAPRS